MSDVKLYTMTPLATAVIAALSPSKPVVAQEAEEESFEMDEILVTATKREMSLQDIPHSIDVLSALQLERMGARDLEATLRALPSLQLTALQPGQNVLTMRGVTTEIFEYTRDGQVAVYLDEQPMTSNAQQVGIRNIDLERVENLPGPQGTLFGSSSQTGTIRYITNKPSMDGFLGEVSAAGATTSGGDESYDFSAILNVPLGDNVAARAVVYKSQDGGYVDNVFGESLSGNYDNAEFVKKDHNVYDVDGGRLHVLWNISDRWSSLFSFVAENTTGDGAWDSDAGLDDYQVTRFFDEFRDDDWTSTSLTLTGDLGFADLSFTATRFERDIVYEYDNMTYTQYRDYLYGTVYCLGAGYYCGYYTNYYPSYIFNDQEQERDAFELRLVSKGDTRFQWMIGAYYEDFLNEWAYGAKTPGLVNTTAFATAYAYAYYYGCPNYYNYYDPNPNQVCPLPATDIHYLNEFSNNVKQTAVFTELGYDLTDDLKIYGGLRWADVDRDKWERNFFPVAGLIAAGDRSSGDGTFRDVGSQSDTIFKVGLQYNVDDDRMVYGLFSQGFRVGGANSQRAAATGRVPATYKGDFLDNYELGIKSQWLDGRLTVNSSLYYMEWKDYQAGASFGGDAPWWLGGTINAGGAETTGLEAAIQWQITDRLYFASSFTYGNAEYQDNFCNNFEDGVNLGCVEDSNGNPIYPDGGTPDILAGQDMPSSPEKRAFASLTYDIPDVFGGDMWVYYDVSYSSGTWNDNGNARDTNIVGYAPSWSFHNFSMGLQLPNQFDITVNVNNLFDQNGYSYVWRGEADDAAAFGDSRYQQQRAQWRPRTTWLTLTKGFGGT